MAVTAEPAARTSVRRERDLARMKRIATGLLVGATVVFLVARVLEDDVSGLSYVRATAEAAMVGALADWFAVTALFRHPLGIPIPHTAIIPNRKDDIGRGLGTFVERNFLTAEVVTERLARHADGRPARRVAGRARATPGGSATRRRPSSPAMIDALQDDEVQDAIEQARWPTSCAAHRPDRSSAEGLDLAIADGRHQQLLSSILHRVAESLDANRDTLRIGSAPSRRGGCPTPSTTASSNASTAGCGGCSRTWPTIPTTSCGPTSTSACSSWPTTSRRRPRCRPGPRR